MRKSEILAVFLFLFSIEKYIQLALNYATWVNMWDKDLAEEYFQLKHELTNYKVNLQTRSQYSAARKSILRSLAIVSAIALAVLMLGFIVDKVHYSYPFDFSKFMSFFGVFFLIWATIYQLRYTGERGGFGVELNKFIHKLFFLSMLSLGALASFIGTL
jgi:predicted membrane protein